MKRLKIRTRMTLWFVLSTVVIAGLLFAALHTMTAALLQQMLENDLALAMEQIIAQIEHEQGGLIYEDETPIASGISCYVMEESGSELFSRGKDITWFDRVPISEGVFAQTTLNQEPFLILDSPVITIEGENVRVRTAASCAQNQRTLRVMRGIFFVMLPVLTLLAALIGFIMMGQSLRPIQHMIDSAQRIIAGDLSGRLPPAFAQDELGKLADTLNQMLDALEASFNRERRFASDASHELRTPVAVIRAAAEALEDELPDSSHEHLDTILRECRRMQRLIEQMLTLTRGQEGRIQLNKERFFVLDVFESISSVLMDAAFDAHISIEIHASPDLTIVADQSLFTQLMFNLAENAIKYGKRNGRVDLSAQTQPGGIRICVADDGAGIPEKDLPHIFERFFRADAARDRSGTGLGLSIAQWIVRAHGGTISANSTYAEGTTFSIFWPEQID